MPTITTVDVAWTPGPVEFTDAEARRFDTAMFLGDGSANGVRGGIVRHGSTSLAVSVNGSDQVTVQPGVCVIPAATGLGVYRGALSAATTATAIDPRNATNPRIDLVVFRSTGAVDIITGTPGSSPSAPALPSGAVELGRLNVPAVSAGAVTVDSTWRAYAVAPGGIIPVETAARLPGSGNVVGQRATALDSGMDYRWTGTLWQPASDTVNGSLGANMTGAVIVDRRDFGRIGILEFDLVATADQADNVAIASVPATAVPVRAKQGHGTNLTTGAVTAAYVEPITGYIRLRSPLATGQQVVGSFTLPL